MARKKQGKKNKTNKPKISYFKSLWYNSGVWGYTLLVRPPMIPYNGVDTFTLEGLVSTMARGVFPATILLGGLRILIFMAPAVKVLAGAVWEAISQDIVSLAAMFSRTDKSPQVLDKRTQLWLFIQFTIMDLPEDFKTLFRPNPGQARWWWSFLVLLVLSVFGFVATALAIPPFTIFTPDTIVINLKVYFVTAIWSLELLGAGKSFRYGQTLKREFPFEAMSIKTDRVKALVNRVVLSPMRTVVAMKFAEALSVTRFIRVRIPKTPRFRASFRLSISKVVIARCTSIFIYIASWVGVSGPVLTPSYPEDLVVFFAVVNMVSSILIALTFIITSNLKTANA